MIFLVISKLTVFLIKIQNFCLLWKLCFNYNFIKLMVISVVYFNSYFFCSKTYRIKFWFTTHVLLKWGFIFRVFVRADLHVYGGWGWKADNFLEKRLQRTTTINITYLLNEIRIIIFKYPFDLSSELNCFNLLHLTLNS